jgi:hypothetical protein
MNYIYRHPTTCQPTATTRDKTDTMLCDMCQTSCTKHPYRCELCRTTQKMDYMLQQERVFPHKKYHSRSGAAFERRCWQKSTVQPNGCRSRSRCGESGTNENYELDLLTLRCYFVRHYQQKETRKLVKLQRDKKTNSPGEPNNKETNCSGEPLY